MFFKFIKRFKSILITFFLLNLFITEFKLIILIMKFICFIVIFLITKFLVLCCIYLSLFLPKAILKKNLASFEKSTKSCLNLSNCIKISSLIYIDTRGNSILNSISSCEFFFTFETKYLKFCLLFSF